MVYFIYLFFLFFRSCILSTGKIVYITSSNIDFLSTI
uniref:Uncharacterized protein n=1 Tax=Anguilla anguilla TaxID=7936 RepID=A0A0E9QV24_ANGAN